ncbi:MAG TPA: hypothetical protein VF228_18990 [Iamia sp.]
MAPRALFVALAAALLLGGCPTQDDDPVVTGDDPPAEETTAPTEPTTTTTGSEPPPRLTDAGPVVAPEGAPTADELRDAMPPADALPGGRFTRAFEPLYDVDATEAAVPLCAAGWTGNHIGEMREPKDLGGISAGYAYEPEEEGPIVLVRAASLPDATAHVADARAQVEACAAAGPDEEGRRVEVGADPGLGDAGVAFTEVSETAFPGGMPLSIGLDLTILAVDDVVMMVMVANPPEIPDSPPADSIEPAAVEAFSELVVERVAALR